MNTSLSSSIELKGKLTQEFEEILTPEAMMFITKLELEFRDVRKKLLQERQMKQASIDAGEMPSFLKQTTPIRKGEWKVNEVLDDLKQRRVEITGPTERKMVINALNSGSDTFMADFEDSNSPTWENMIQGHINLRDAVRGTIEFTNAKGKHYKLNEKTATLLVRARGWHLEEKHFLVNGEPISGGIFDFGLYFFHNANALIDKGSGPYFYLPKLQNRFEARLWNDIFNKAQDELNIPRGTIKATVLIEHILAAFETEEILHALKIHSSGLNCGRWDYIFSFIKTFKENPKFILPDRSQITMDVHFMESYCKEVIRSCHKRGAHAMGGMAAQIPIKNNPEANESALEKVRLDKVREVNLGFSGAWVAHPGLVKTVYDIFDNNTKKPNLDYKISPKDLLTVPKGTITNEGVRMNVSVGIEYIYNWIKGNGCVAINNLMEDLATSEISRSQIWQWIKYRAKTDSFQEINTEYISSICQKEAAKLPDSDVAKDLFWEIISSNEYIEFIPDICYERLF